MAFETRDRPLMDTLRVFRAGHCQPEQVKDKICSNVPGRNASPVGWLVFKTSGGCQAVLCGFDSHFLPPDMHGLILSVKPHEATRFEISLIKRR